MWYQLPTSVSNQILLDEMLVNIVVDQVELLNSYPADRYVYH